MPSPRTGWTVDAPDGTAAGRVVKEVLLTDGAARDLDEWYAAAHARGGSAEANRILDQIQVVLGAVAASELDDTPVPELRHLGRRPERQVVTDEGLRLVFRSTEERVLVMLIAPQRASFQALLERRLLDA